MNHIFAIIILNLLSNKMGDGSADGCVKVLTKIKKAGDSIYNESQKLN